MTEVVIDATGLACPQPIILLSQRISEVAIGESLILLADDPAAIFDVPAWCRMTKNVLKSNKKSTFIITRRS